MALSSWLWAAGAGLALLNGLWTILARHGVRQGRPLPWLAPLAAALWLALAGLGRQAWESRFWPGRTPAEALALLAGGSLVVVAWLALRADAEGRPTARCTALGPTLIAAGLLLGAGAALTALGFAPAGTPALPPARAWFLGARDLFASIGLGGWIVAWTASVAWLLRIWRRSQAVPRAQQPTEEPTTPPELPEPIEPEAAWPAEDFGRRAALFSFPWLTAACLCNAAWNLVAHAAVVQASPAELWTLSAWLIGAAYLHVTSSWQPLRLPGWLAPLLAALVVAAGILAAGSTTSLR